MPPSGLWSATRIASTNAATKPAPQTTAATSLRDAPRHEHRHEQQRAAAAIIATTGESANQSTLGVSIVISIGA